VARGFAEAMGGTLNAEDTPGGGLTMVLTLRAAGSPRTATALFEATRSTTAERQAAR
jgi:two-component system sensor histidine kinase KdpD